MIGAVAVRGRPDLEGGGAEGQWSYSSHIREGEGKGAGSRAGHHSGDSVLLDGGRVNSVLLDGGRGLDAQVC